MGPQKITTYRYVMIFWGSTHIWYIYIYTYILDRVFIYTSWPHHGGVDMWNYMKNVLAFMFLVNYLFVCLIFLHFYICNFWFILANNRVLVFILELFLFLKFLTMFLSVNMCKFCKYIFNSYCKWYIWKQSFKGSP